MSSLFHMLKRNEIGFSVLVREIERTRLYLQGKKWHICEGLKGSTNIIVQTGANENMLLYC